jgi:hypothetical protein
MKKLILISSFAFLFSLNNKTHAQTNVRIDPLSALIGVLNTTVDFKLSSSWTLGPTFQYLSREIDSYDAMAYGVGVRVNYYFEREAFSQGWYLGPSFRYASAEVETNDPTFGKITGEASGIAAGLLAGYQWMWESFNINLGAGFVYSSLGTIKVENKQGNYSEDFSGYDGVDLDLEFTLGWKF